MKYISKEQILDKIKYLASQDDFIKYAAEMRKLVVTDKSVAEENSDFAVRYNIGKLTFVGNYAKINDPGKPDGVLKGATVYYKDCPLPALSILDYEEIFEELEGLFEGQIDNYFKI